MTANAVNGTNGSSAAQAASSTGSSNSLSKLGQDDFLKLMVTQMKQQDPFKPVDDGQFLAQMAQFTSASGISDLQKSFADFQQTMSQDQALKAASLVGHHVMVQSNVGSLSADGSMDGAVTVPSSADGSTVKVGVYSPAGDLVDEIDMGRLSAGTHAFSWDGKAADGTPLPPGPYVIKAMAGSQDGQQALTTLASAQVDSVQLGRNGQGPSLSLQGLGEVSFSDVEQIR